ncbi:3-deoxy-manno-octulosonate cytidylyltransferase [Candidatus Endomicrobiellum agilis]|jgi:3-deoxy-manno-octulosonate cytidylyltransferase (CMP-KDO synthetase)|uniref:3-deoxy-manno-octulosonate cytidylyltransferase n=1 Tax=Candidatus Endomicrobiellum agilis TaxID=3238957 RepID=UPI002844D0C5|nr:3-deoxy-manno-octulosonate cytidylyltransferase [Endomicrobium sp.]MDR3092386.1 3-deoxy-manno-octulosonate cytidylyltransferase [Endomicrobium sp.]
MKTSIIIPSRYGSGRFPGKPLALIKGKPLIQFTLERVKKCKEVDFIAVATDDERIYDAVKKMGFNVFMTPKTCKSGTDRIAFTALKFLKDYGIFINVQCDEPLIEPNLIDKLALLLKKDKSLEYITAASPIIKEEFTKNPNAIKVVFDKNGYALYFSRFAIPYNRENIKVKYYKHIGIYGYKRKSLLEFSKNKMSPLEKSESLEQLRILENGKKIKIVITKHNSIGVDTPEDASELEKYL